MKKTKQLSVGDPSTNVDLGAIVSKSHMNKILQYIDYNVFISKENIKGVVFFSGDRHFAEIHKLNYPNLSYPLYDFTTSPLSSPRHHLFFIEEKKNVKTRVPGSFYSNKNFLKCIVENVNNIDILKFQYKNKNGKIVFQQSLSEYDLGY